MSCRGLREKIILPIWQQLEKEDILNFSPTLLDKKALNSDGNNIVEMAKLIAELIQNSPAPNRAYGSN